jgi:hypothetical protein
MSGAEAIANTGPIDFRPHEIAARTTVAADWRAEAQRYDIRAANEPDPQAKKAWEYIAKDLRDSAAQLLETIQ